MFLLFGNIVVSRSWQEHRDHGYQTLQEVLSFIKQSDPLRSVMGVCGH